MKNIWKLLTNRLLFIGLLIVLQLVWIVLFLYDVCSHYSYVHILLEIYGVILALIIIMKWTNPAVKLSWVFLLLCMPVIGVPVYLLFGRSDLTKHSRQHLNTVSEKLQKLMPYQSVVLERLYKKDAQAALQAEYILRSAHYPLYSHTMTCFYKTGEQLFQAMLEDIRKAEKYIFLEYFIIEQGEMYDLLIDLLIQKAKSGVDVRMIYDDLVSGSKMPTHFYKKLQEQGIRCAAFNPMRPLLSVFMNHRDHRKLIVIDGIIGYTGGINIADEYINAIEKYGYWKDNGLRLEGEAVYSFTAMFLEMWEFITDCREDYHCFFQNREKYHYYFEEGYVQPYGVTPLNREKTGENVYLNMINRAERYVYIYTPYLIPDQEILTALCNAAKCGVDIRIITPGIPDKKLIYRLTRSNYGILLESGVRIFEYQPGFLHGKCFVCDDKYAIVGSINLDYRSLYLHFECGVWMYQTQAVSQVYADICESMKVSCEVFLKDDQKTHPTDFLTALLHLAAPLL